MIGAQRIHPSESPDIHRACRIKKISTGLGITLFILSLAFPAYIIKTTVTKEPTYTIVKQNVTKNDTQTIGVSKPSYQLYSQLYSTYPQDVQCTCSHASINYDSFLGLQPQYHQICNSTFISQQWIDALLHTSETLFLNDFRKTAPYSFQALNTLCQLSQQTVDNNLREFLSNEYVNPNLLPPELFQVLMASRFAEFRLSTENSFLLSFLMIRKMIQTNALFSSLQTNYKLYTQGNNISIYPSQYDDGCNCALSTQCNTQSSIYDHSSGTTLFQIPGFYTGCYVIDSLLQSDLRCFYNQTCIDLIQSYMPSLTSNFVASALDASLSDPNITIEIILNHLMIQSWSTIFAYGRYYEQCAPSYCTYPVQTTETIELTELIENKVDVPSLIGLVIGITGGIIAILHLIIPALVKHIVGGN